MEPTYFEVTFSKTDPSQQEYFKAYIEIDDQDKMLIQSKMNDELKIRQILHRTGILSYLPAGVWKSSGRIIEPGIVGHWNGGIEPIVANGRKIWLVPGPAS